IADDLRVDKLELLLLAGLTEDPLARSQYDWEDHQVQLVDQVVLEQGLRKLPTAVDVKVPAMLISQASDRVDRVAVEHGRVSPARRVRLRPDNVLWHVVEPVSEVALALRPRVGEAIVRHAAKQEGLGVQHFVVLKLVALVASRELKRPAPVLEVLRPAR